MAGRKAQKSGTSTATRNTRSGSKKTVEAGVTNSTQTGSTATKSSGPSKALTYEQIAQRAEAIWLQNGCQAGQDEQNWREAEAQLKAEMGIA
ncbi:MAG: DUF2934 domain-containing protein [Sedimentisphaerales bacterium]|jgi:hypothetical protein|nr:DUF2934 domain-containing protein [Planctomycetota bacterium]MDY0354674.1 DUF2934 domain-containing protein [Sedimentisphaerales bacterium]